MSSLKHTFVFLPKRVLGQGFFGTVQQGTWTVENLLPVDQTPSPLPFPSLTDVASPQVNKVTREVAIKSIPRKLKTRRSSTDSTPTSLNNLPYIQVEVDVLAQHRKTPFINSLYAVIQDSTHVHLVLQYCPGGDLFSLIQTYRLSRFEPTTSASFHRSMKFWASEIVLALFYLHSNHIMHGDLKCENLLIDSVGHIRVCDFGLSELNCKRNCVFGRRGTDLFISPEQMQQKMFGLAVDIWALGYIFLHMFTTLAPQVHKRNDAVNCNVINLTEMTTRHPETDPFLRDMHELIGALLNVDRQHRPTIQEVMVHDAFKDVDWLAVENKSNDAPWIPTPTADYFDASFTALPTTAIRVEDCTSLTHYFDQVSLRWV